jgi:anti-sigma factor RsiW
MTNDAVYQRLREATWRRPLTAAEQAELRAWLATHPEAQTEWEAESGLNATLGRLLDVPVPSNFTARVMQAVELEAAAEARQPVPRWRAWRRRWLPRLAIAAVGVALLTYYQVRAARRAEFARSVAAISSVSSLPSPEILQDFDAIYMLNQTPPADEELLNLLK